MKVKNLKNKLLVPTIDEETLPQILNMAMNQNQMPPNLKILSPSGNISSSVVMQSNNQSQVVSMSLQKSQISNFVCEMENFLPPDLSRNSDNPIDDIRLFD